MAVSHAVKTTAFAADPEVANFVLCQLPASQPTAAVVIEACRRRNVFLRDVSNMGSCFDARTLRLAVKDAENNATMLAIIQAELPELSRSAVRAA